ncbi:protein TIFY 5A [Cucurbita pepo subsp. pepo]|uniref:protein TIFY 5A n=1 Tax=Cucurbita pepo subsp. pepo TaxID=3664 RepID=UPI000C9D2F77|nr:protein TIFY 5A [Cucurbita pepo subsp. pepo]
MKTNSSLRMRRNCNLELRLSPTSSAIAAVSDQSSAAVAAANASPQSQQLTIFYNGRICVCDATELQAIAILKLATREMEEKGPNETPWPILQQSPAAVTPTTPGLSMKRSLQRFLQKRKHRAQPTSPPQNYYNNGGN